MTDFEAGSEYQWPYPPAEIVVDADIRMHRMSVADAPLLSQLMGQPIDDIEEGLRQSDIFMEQRRSASYITDYQDQSVAWVNLHDRDGTTASLGYGVVESAHGKGIATRSAHALCDWGLNLWGLEQININVDPPDNQPSIRVAERLGAVEFGETTMEDDPSWLVRRFVLRRENLTKSGEDLA